MVQSVLSGNVEPNAFGKLVAFNLHRYLDFEVGGYGSDDRVRANLVCVARTAFVSIVQTVLDRVTVWFELTQVWAD
ncbi:MAG: hypothetical protein ACRDPT_16795 [Streptomycetales bacterium]